MASKPLNPYADPFLSSPPTLLPPLPPSPHVLDYTNFYYPRSTSTYLWQLHTYSAVSCYNAWPQVMCPPYQAAVGFSGTVMADSKNIGKADVGKFRREFVVSGGARRELVKSMPQWVERKIDNDAGGCGGDGVDPVEKTLPPCLDITTVMIKNIPNQFKWNLASSWILKIFLEEGKLKEEGSSSVIRQLLSNDEPTEGFSTWRSWYEGKVSNLGYAFVNFTTSKAATQFSDVYHNYKWDVNVNRKICEITEARIQGKEALKNAFKNKIFWCRNDQYLPVMLFPASNGRRRYRRVNVGRRIPRLPRKPLKKV
uniref:Mei2-like C-terminal RNA recognition motif domain-containing protein n=1 Tax=Cucumis sativus TaxID=3659 RepID=A0A0A0KRH5_CUCSA